MHIPGPDGPGKDSVGLRPDKRNIKTYTGGKIIRVNNDVEFISRHSSASEYGPDAKPLIVVSEKHGIPIH